MIFADIAEACSLNGTRFISSHREYQRCRTRGYCSHCEFRSNNLFRDATQLISLIISQYDTVSHFQEAPADYRTQARHFASSSPMTL